MSAHNPTPLAELPEKWRQHSVINLHTATDAEIARAVAYACCVDDLSAALTAHHAAQVEPARYFVSGPQGEFYADDPDFAQSLISIFDRDDWTITDLRACTCSPGEGCTNCPSVRAGQIAGQEAVAYTNGNDVILAKHWTADDPPKGWHPLTTLATQPSAPTDGGVLRDALQRIVEVGRNSSDAYCAFLVALKIAREALAATPAAGGDASRNWDDGEDNDYENVCLNCKQLFMGHKRRLACRQCVEQSRVQDSGAEVVDLSAALNRVRARAGEPGTRQHHGAQYVEGMRCAANMLEGMRIAKSVHYATPQPSAQGQAVESDAALLQRLGTDGAAWTGEFCKRYPANDWSVMVGWFANAIEAGRSAAQQSAANGAGDAVNFRGESLYEARRLLVNVLKAQKSWLTDYAEAFIDDFVRQTARATQPAGAERGEG